MMRPTANVRLFARFGLAFATIAVLAFLLTFAGRALAAPEAHILRIDPRAGVSNGKPVLTTVIEVVQFKRLSEVLQPCASENNYERSLTCWSEKIETPGALWSPFPFPEAAAHLLVSVAGQDKLSGFVDKEVWGKSKAQPGVGTAWLITLDASNGMGARYTEAQKVAYEFIQSMQANDLIDLMIFDDRQVIKDSKWKTFKDRNAVVALLQSQPTTAAKHGSDRPLFEQIKTMTKDGFGSLGNSDQPDAIPLHQAMVVLSNGSGRGDAASASPSAEVFHTYLNDGRFGGNDATPKTPLPVISIWFPAKGGGIVTDLYKNNDAQFMQALGNPEIGGFFDIVQEGQGDAKGKTIIGLVRARFDAMWLIHWKLSCVNPSVLQSFNLVFENTKPAILPDATFKNVPLGVDPTQWPLDVDFDKTTKEAQANPLYPGGQFRIYGDFCWGGDKGRAEAYFIPAGTKPDPNATNSRDPELAKKAMQQLIAQNMRGGAVEVGDTFATMMIPDDDKILEGTGDNTVARVVLYDNNAHRASAIDQKTVLSLKATKKPLPWLIILAVALGVIAILLLVIVLMRSGGGGKKRGGSPPPQQAPPPGYGAPPYGGAPPGAGGPYQMSGDAYGGGAAMMGAPQPAFAGGGMAMGSPMAAPMVAATPMAPAPPIDLVAAAPAVVQVRCPACQMMTMATPGQPSVCFSCGQPLPANIAGGGGAVNAPTFPLTGAMSSVLAPPPNPYGAGAGAFGAAPSAATISGSHGQFLIRPGGEVRVGRDAAQCPIFLSEPRVSGVHSSLKFEGGQLWVRDETSNNGTWIAGARIAPGTWVPVPPGAQLRFGPIEFSVTFEA
jgi:hypothetical protein